MKIKDFGAEIKAAGKKDGLKEGEFKALVSVFGNKDSYGDVVQPGAFKKSLDEWAAKGDSIPVIWSHDWSDPFSHIGAVSKAEETDQGLVVTFSIDTEDNPKAKQIERLLKSRRVTQFSFAYDVVDGAFGEKDGDEVYHLNELKVHEVGPCLIGANQATELLEAKANAAAQATKDGRVLSKESVRHLEAAKAAIDEALNTSAPSGVDSKTQEDEPVIDSPVDDDSPVEGKSTEADQSHSRRALAAARIATL